MRFKSYSLGVLLALSSIAVATPASANAVWIDPEHDMVTVVRWIDREKLDGFWKRVLAAIK